MSYLTYYKSYNYILNPPEYKNNNCVSLENNSFEKIKELLIKVYRSVVDFFKKVSNWVKTKLKLFFNSNIFKEKLEKINLLIRSPIFVKYCNNNILENSIKDLLTRILNNNSGFSNSITLEENTENDNDIIDKVRNAFRNYNPKLLREIFKKDGRLFDITSIYNDSQKLITEIIDDINQLTDHKRSTTRRYDFFRFINKLNGVGGTNNRSDGITSITEIKSLNKEELFKYVKDFDSEYNKALAWYSKIESKISPKITGLKEEINYYYNLNKNNPDIHNDLEFKNLYLKLDGFMVCVKIASTPINILLFYYRLMDMMYKDVLTKVDITVSTLKHGRLYHISDNPDLCGSSTNPSGGVMYPELPISGRKEFLPKRSCFSETIEGCLLATNHDTINSSKISKDTVVYNGVSCKYLDIYLYEGIPDKDTKYIDPIILTHQTRDADYTGEIAITTPIRICYLGEIRIYINPSFKKGIIYRCLGWDYKK